MADVINEWPLTLHHATTRDVASFVKETSFRNDDDDELPSVDYSLLNEGAVGKDIVFQF